MWNEHRVVDGFLAEEYDILCLNAGKAEIVRQNRNIC